MQPDEIHATEITEPPVESERHFWISQSVLMDLCFGKGCRPYIGILMDDILLEIFHCYRLDVPLGWNHKWWYKLMHTCRRWRYIILESASSLQLHLYFTYGKPIEEMLRYSPPLPLYIDYGKALMSTTDEEGVLLALRHHHHRVRLINLREPALQKLVGVMGKPFTMLEDLRLISLDPWYRSQLPETFTAQRLRHLSLIQVGDVWVPGLPLLTSITGLVTLSLREIPSPTSLPINYLVSRLSLMPLLEYLSLEFGPVELQPPPPGNFTSDLAPHQTQIVQLCKLDEIVFRGRCRYLEGLVSCIRAPLLTSSTLLFFPQPTIPLPYLSEFLAAAEKLRYPVCSFAFSGANEDDPGVSIAVAGLEEFVDQSSEEAPFRIRFPCGRLGQQVARAARISTALAPMLSSVERLHLKYHATRWVKWSRPEIPREAWFELLRPFFNVQELQLDTSMARILSYALCPEGGPPAEVILPKLSTLLRPHHARFESMLDPFIAARQATGQAISKSGCPPTSDSESEDELWWFSSDEEVATELDFYSDFDSEE